MNAALGIIALLPLLLGPAPAGGERITATLCIQGRSVQVEMPMPGKRPEPPAPCSAKGCHAGSCRKRN